MMITGKHLHRRTFLQRHGRGDRAADARRHDAGVRRGRARAAKAPRRLAFTYVPNGVIDGGLDAEGGGRRIRVPAHPEAARAVPRRHRSCCPGLAHQNGNALGDGPGDHARAGASYLTGVHPRKTAGADIQNGISVDQIAAQHLGRRDTRSVARARLRRLADGRQLRLRLLVRLHQQPRLARARDADAARRRTRASSSSGCSATSTPSLHPEARARRLHVPPQHPRPRRASGRRSSAGRSRPDRPPQARRVPDVDPRDRAADRRRPSRT